MLITVPSPADLGSEDTRCDITCTRHACRFDCNLMALVPTYAIEAASRRSWLKKFHEPGAEGSVELLDAFVHFTKAEHACRQSVDPFCCHRGGGILVCVDIMEEFRDPVVSSSMTLMLSSPPTLHFETWRRTGILCVHPARIGLLGPICVCLYVFLARGPLAGRI